MRPTIFAVPARVAFAKPVPRSLPKPWWPWKRKSRWSPKLPSGPRRWLQASALRPWQSRCTKFCSSQTKTLPNTKRLSRPHAPLTPGRWNFYSAVVRSTLPTSFTGNAFYLKTSPKGLRLAMSRRLRWQMPCHWRGSRPFLLMTLPPQKLTMPCPCKVWARARSRWVCILPRLAWRFCPEVILTS